MFVLLHRSSLPSLFLREEMEVPHSWTLEIPIGAVHQQERRDETRMRIVLDPLNTYVFNWTANLFTIFVKRLATPAW